MEWAAMPARKRVFAVATVLMTAWLCVWGARILVPSMRWPMIDDAPVLVYMGWLANHGMRLYRDVVEVQFPGSVMLYSAVRMVFGKTDLGFRIFDLVVLGSMLLSMIAITRREGKVFAAVFGFAYVLWTHTGVHTGIQDLGQRDFIIGAMLLGGVVPLLRAERTGQMRWMAVFGFLVGLAMTIKPNAAVFLLVPLPCFRHAGFRERHWRAALLWLMAGMVVAFALVAGYLIKHQAFFAFFANERRVLPLYYGILQTSYKDMWDNLNYPARLWPPVVLGCVVVLYFEPEIRRKTVQQLLLVGALCGAVTYFTQHKGIYYHREPCYAFFFVWVGWVLVSGTRSSKGWLSAVSGLVLLGTVMSYPLKILASDPALRTDEQMLSELKALGALDRDGQVQCIDTVAGCTGMMLRAERAMTTGTLDSFLLFPPQASPQVLAERRLFLGKLEATPPQYFVISNVQWPFIRTFGYEKLAKWPEFDAYLRTNYIIRYEQAPTTDAPIAFRVYERKSGGS